jgi:hypothetical protein
MRLREYLSDVAVPFEMYGSELLAGAACWLALQAVLYVASLRLFPEFFGKAAAHARLEFTERLVSFIHAVVVSVWVAYVFVTDGIARWSDVLSDPQTASAQSSAAVKFSVSFFLWDLLVCVLRVRQLGFAFLLHSVCSVFAFSQCLRPFMQFFGCASLLCELSTPWLNIRGILISLKRTDTAVFTIVQFLFAIFFFVIRILFLGE